MLGDQTQPAESDGSRADAPTGPRHAAPRKSLLTKLHVPAGKAVALAAMPTAVLMGMGFTPHFAQADEMPKNPFKPGPCVTQSDTPSATAKSGANTAPKPTTTPSANASGTSGKGSGAVTPTPGASGSAPSVTAPVAGILPKAQAAPKTTPSASPSPTPSPARSGNPLDPLGVGGLLGGLLGGLTGGGKSTPTPTPTTPSPRPTPSASSTPTPDPTTSAPAADTGSKSAGGGSSATSATSAAKTAKQAAKKAVKGLTSPPSTAGTASPSPAPTNGSQPYPCPTYDAKALAAAQTEGGIPLLPDAPWTLKSSKLTLHGLNYDGIVQVRTWSGTVKDVLKFTATGLDIQDLFQIVDDAQGGHTWVTARAGSTSTIRNGTVTMYTESLSGNLLGLVPITFTPKAPPPLTLPELFFTDVTAVQAGQFGGDLHVPGMQVQPGKP